MIAAEQDEVRYTAEKYIQTFLPEPFLDRMLKNVESVHDR